MTPDEWMALMPAGIREAHLVVVIYCPTPEAYPGQAGGPECQAGAEALAVLEVSPTDDRLCLPDVQAAAMIRQLADHHTERALATAASQFIGDLTAAAEASAERSYRSPN